MTEYRQDDRDQGYCPHCGRTLTGLTRAARGYCEQHGWQWAEWTPKQYVVIVKVDATGYEYQSTIGTHTYDEAELIAAHERADARRFGQIVTVTIKPWNESKVASYD